jgi:NAD(P)-dependent dehydrogenase (short-subunit alcohol dehydrogenase family)
MTSPVSAAKNITDLTGRVAVVIGGTSGLGRAIATGLAGSGADVVATGRRRDRAQEVCDAIQSLGRRTLCHTVDVADIKSIHRMRDAVVKDLGRVDILVNAAGRTMRKAAKDLSESDWTSILDTNLLGMVRACQSFYPVLKASGHGRVINIASLASFVAFMEVAPYNVSKGGVRALTQTLAIEWAKDLINVNAIAPGVFPTDINASLLEGTDRGRELITRTPMKRFGKPEELAGAAVFLASDAASFITGTLLAVDGGFLASGVNS